MSSLSRREFLSRLCAAYVAALSGCKRGDLFAREAVCIHIYEAGDPIPRPLLTRTTANSRGPGRDYFEVGLPELVLCSTRTRFLDMFEYFWPFSRQDFERLQRSVTIEFQKDLIRGDEDVETLAKHIRETPHASRRNAATAVLFTFNDYTAQFAAAIAAVFRTSQLQEFIVFKDPTQPPYLCEYPARQKGFRKPPP